MHNVADLTARGLAQEASRDWLACMSEQPAVYYDMDYRETIEARMFCRLATAREMRAFNLHPSASRLVTVFTATYGRSGGDCIAERYLVRLPLGVRVPSSTGEALWCAGYLIEGDYVELTEETIGALRSRATQNGGAQ